MKPQIEIFEDLKSNYGFMIEDIPYLIFMLILEMESLREDIKSKFENEKKGMD